MQSLLDALGLQGTQMGGQIQRVPDKQSFLDLQHLSSTPNFNPWQQKWRRAFFNSKLQSMAAKMEERLCGGLHLLQGAGGSGTPCTHVGSAPGLEQCVTVLYYRKHEAISKVIVQLVLCFPPPLPCYKYYICVCIYTLSLNQQLIPCRPYHWTRTNFSTYSFQLQTHKLIFKE